jgi:hypothetical protein
MKMTAFWDMALCSLVEVDQRLRDAYRPDYGGSTFTPVDFDGLWCAVVCRHVVDQMNVRLSVHQTSISVYYAMKSRCKVGLVITDGWAGTRHVYVPGCSDEPRPGADFCTKRRMTAVPS